jgi:hypothetical protein
MRKFFFILCAILFSAAAAVPAYAMTRIRTMPFDAPDIKDDFCGARIDYRLCKCAFHNDFCKDIGRSEATAGFMVRSAYAAHIAELRSDFVAHCISAGGTFAKDRCDYYEPNGKEARCLPGDFERQWKKYSDLDDAIPIGERSAEARAYAETLAKKVDNAAEIFLLRRDMEIDRQARLAAKEYKAALVKNIKTNLLKSFWRLAWITYDNIQSGRASGGTFEKMYDLPSLGEGMAAYLKTIRSVTPGDSTIAINTETVMGKVKNVGLSAALDAVESVGDPATVATTLVSESVKQTFGSADITPEEVELLKNQHLGNRLVDDAIQESYRANRARRLKADRLAAENERLSGLLAELEMKERDRTRDAIVRACDR